MISHIFKTNVAKGNYANMTAYSLVLRMKLSDARPLNSCKVFIEEFRTHENAACSTCQTSEYHKEAVATDEEYETVLKKCACEYADDIRAVQSVLHSVGVEQEALKVSGKITGTIIFFRIHKQI